MENDNYTQILEEIYSEITPLLGEGNVADYIPELKRIDPKQFGMAICANNNDEYIIGSAEKCFSIQSISKVFSFSIAYKLLGEKLWQRLGNEPSGSSFNSLVLLEHECGIPRNPFINAGALVITDILLQNFKDPAKEILKLLQELSGNPNLTFNQKVQESELNHSDRLYALAYFMKSFGNIHSNIDDLINAYTTQCSIEMSCTDLARSFRLFSSNGCNPWNQERYLTKRQTKRINAVMMTCGLYNAVGNFALKVGFPAKSGVGGGICGVIPNEMSLAAWCPALDQAGNSVMASKALELFTTKTGLSIY